jgi:phosphinothricin acetyltransferase
MHVRQARATDSEAMRRIYNHEVTNSTATFDLVPRTIEEQARWLADHQGTHPAIVAIDDDGTVLGFGSLAVFRDRPSYSITVENSVYVDKDQRGRGIGRMLLTELVELATGLGYHSVVARISGDNEASIALHRECGFAMVGIEREVGRKFGRWLDVAIMQRMLGSRASG